MYEGGVLATRVIPWKCEPAGEWKDAAFYLNKAACFRTDISKKVIKMLNVVAEKTFR